MNFSLESARTLWPFFGLLNLGACPRWPWRSFDLPACGDSRASVLVPPPLAPSLFTFSLTHSVQKCPHSGCQGPMEQSTKFKKYGSLTYSIQIHCDDLSEPTLLTLHGGCHGSEERKGPQAGHTPHQRLTVSAPCPVQPHPGAEHLPTTSLPRFCFQSPMSPDTSDPFDKLKPGGPRRRTLLPGHMTGKGSPLNCSPPLPETLVVRSSSGSDGCEEL